MSIMHPFDVVVARSWAGRILSRTEQITPPAVYSNRLGRPPPGWTFRDYRVAWKEMRKRAVELVHAGYFMAQLDVSSYYPTVNMDLLAPSLVSMGCETSAAIGLTGLYERWHDDGLSGLPIGTEDAGVVGNAFLLPLDWRLLATPGLVHLRWMDDVYIFSRDLKQLHDSVPTVDDELDLLELERSEAKTTIYESRDEALAALEDSMLTSLFQAIRRRPWTGRLLHQRFVEHVMEADEVNVRQYRALLAGLLNRRDPFGVSEIIFRPDLFDLDPALSGEYVRTAGLGINSAMEGIFIFLEQGELHPADESDARDLHGLRVLEGRIWGRAEGELFERIALDTDRRGPIRAWATACWARTPSWRPHDVVERTLEETDVYLRRSMVLMLRKSVDDQRVASFIRHLRTNPDDLLTCSIWTKRL